VYKIRSSTSQQEDYVTEVDVRDEEGGGGGTISLSDKTRCQVSLASHSDLREKQEWPCTGVGECLEEMDDWMVCECFETFTHSQVEKHNQMQRLWNRILSTQMANSEIGDSHPRFWGRILMECQV